MRAGREDAFRVGAVASGETGWSSVGVEEMR